MAKREQLAVRFDEEERKALEKAAQKSQRSMAFLVRQFVRDGLKQMGLLPQTKEDDEK